MRIVLFIGCLCGGGAERVVANLANHLAEEGHDTTVLTVSTEQTYHISPAVKWVKLCSESERQLPHKLLNVLRMGRLICFFLTFRTDVYLTFLPKLSKTILRFRKLIKVPIILAERADPGTYYRENPKNRNMMELYYPRADAFVFQTTDARDFYAETLGLRNMKCTVIPNAVNTAFVGKSYEGKRSKRIVSAGRLDEQKNYSLLIDAFAEFKKIMPGYQLVIYGEGPKRSALEKRIADLSLTECVFLPGRTDQIVEAIRDASLFVLPSDYEGMPNALAEAMALGLPCIATDCPAGGSRFLIDDGKTGILIPVRDQKALVDAMMKVLSDDEMAKMLANNARKIADELTPEKTYGAWEKFITDVVNKK